MIEPDSIWLRKIMYVCRFSLFYFSILSCSVDGSTYLPRNIVVSWLCICAVCRGPRFPWPRTRLVPTISRRLSRQSHSGIKVKKEANFDRKFRKLHGVGTFQHDIRVISVLELTYPSILSGIYDYYIAYAPCKNVRSIRYRSNKKLRVLNKIYFCLTTG